MEHNRFAACCTGVGAVPPSVRHPGAGVRNEESETPMPAVNVPDNLVLPRLAVPDGTVRAVKSLSDAPSGFEGEGFPVRRAFAGVSAAELDPFVHMDQMGEVEYAPGEPKGTPWHPHRGFETVTYMIDGTFQHQDSIGGGGLITNGATQWMTAGRGDLAHRATARTADRQRGPVPRHPALGEPSRGRQVDRPPLPGHRGRRRRSCSLHPTAAHWYGSSPATSADTTGPGSPTRRSRWCTPRWSPGPSLSCPGHADSTRWSTSWRDTARWAPRRRPFETGQLAVFGSR